MNDSSARQQAALAIAVRLGRQLGLVCDEARVLKDSNNTVVYLAPSPVVAKVGTTNIRPDASATLSKELEVGRFLISNGAPIVPPATDVPPGPHREEGSIITLWSFAENDPDEEVVDQALADMLARFHRAFSGYPGELPEFTDSLTRARAALENPSRTPALGSDDRAFLLAAAATIERELSRHAYEVHPLHGDPHLDGNVLKTRRGPLLVDFEAACLGPYEWDLTSLEHARLAYPDLDEQLFMDLGQMRSLCVSVWCWMQYGRAPEVDEAAIVHLHALRESSP